MISIPTEARKADISLETVQLKKAAMILRAVNHKLRYQMLQIIHKTGKIAVTEIYVRLRIEQSVASQHLAILRKAGFVHTQRDGKQIFYSVNHQRMQQVLALTKEINS